MLLTTTGLSVTGTLGVTGLITGAAGLVAEDTTAISVAGTGNDIRIGTIGNSAITSTADLFVAYLNSSNPLNPSGINGSLLLASRNTASAEVVLAATNTISLRAKSSGVTIPGTVAINTTSTAAKLEVYPGNVTTVGTIASSGLMIGNFSGNNCLSQIGFGYTTGATNTTAYIALVETSGAAFAFGDLIFGTRSVTTDTIPTERMRITSTGYSKISSTGSIVNVNGPYHEIVANPNSMVISITNSASTLNSTINGLNVYYQNAAPNSTVACFLYNEDTGGQRSALRSNGGLANYSANDVNLSDETVKSDFIAMPSFRDEFAAMHGKWTRYKYLDQTHSDYNSGYRAQDIRDVFGAKAPELVDWWQTEERIEVEDAETGEKADKLVPIPESERKLAVYNDDLHNIAMSVLSELIIEQNTLREEFQSYKSSHP